ncbi:MAG: O-methyltransferase [Methanobacteriota archaeon]
MPLVAPDALDFIRRWSAAEDGALAALSSECDAKGIAHVMPEEGRFLELIARAAKARRTIETGPGLGYASVWIARGTGPEGFHAVVEETPERAKEVLRWFRDLGLSDRLEAMHGDVLSVLPTLPQDGFDLVFLHGDPRLHRVAMGDAIRILAPGGTLVANGVLEAPPEARESVQAFLRAVHTDADFTTLVLPLGTGLSVSVKRPSRTLPKAMEV